MSGWSPFIWVELVLVAGVVLAWGLNELRVLRREARRREQARRPPDGG